MVPDVGIVALERFDERWDAVGMEFPECVAQGVALPVVAVAESLCQRVDCLCAAGVDGCAVGLERGVFVFVEDERQDGLEVLRIADLADDVGSGEAVGGVVAGGHGAEGFLGFVGVLDDRPSDVFSDASVSLDAKRFDEDRDEAGFLDGAEFERGMAALGGRLAGTQGLDDGCGHGISHFLSHSCMQAAMWLNVQSRPFIPPQR